MNELLSTVMEGARNIMRAQSINANNLANANTDGFKSELAQIYRDENGVEVKSSPNFTQGVLKTTGRDLDISIDGDGWIAVQAPNGVEGYSRRGDLQIDSLGQLTDGARNPIIGNSGPIALPPFAAIEIGSDGTISIQPQGSAPNTMAVVDRIKLVLPERGSLLRGTDGVMRMPNNETAVPDASVKLFAGTLESSNVNAVEEMVKMIDLARHFEAEIKLMQSAKENASALARIISLN